MTKTNKPSSSDDQRRRFVEAAREAECSEGEAAFDETLRRIAKAKPPKSREVKKKEGHSS